jgi:hypothetical protein
MNKLNIVGSLLLFELKLSRWPAQFLRKRPTDFLFLGHSSLFVLETFIEDQLSIIICM